MDAEKLAMVLRTVEYLDALPQRTDVQKVAVATGLIAEYGIRAGLSPGQVRAALGIAQSRVKRAMH